MRGELKIITHGGVVVGHCDTLKAYRHQNVRDGKTTKLDIRFGLSEHAEDGSRITCPTFSVILERRVDLAGRQTYEVANLDDLEILFDFEGYTPLPVVEGVSA